MLCPNGIHKSLYSASLLQPHVMQWIYLTEVLFSTTWRRK